MGDYVSLIHESKITYTQDFCHAHQKHTDILVEVPHFVEVEIPILVYKFKEVLIKYEESDLKFNNIDDIIDKYSRNYDQLYRQSRNRDSRDSSREGRERDSRDSRESRERDSRESRETPDVVAQTPAPSNIVASIMLNSNHHMLPK
jgi:hypothetical protein